MQTINLSIDNDIYEDIKTAGIDIQKKFNEFLAQFAFVDDGYPAIGTEEARRRVANAVNEYKMDKGTYFSEDEYVTKMSSIMEKLELKYGNN